MVKVSPAPENEPTGDLRFYAALDALRALDKTTEPNADYWRLFLTHEAHTLAPNFKTQTGVISDGERFSPVTVHNNEPDNSYPCSLQTQYVQYPLSELGLVPSKGMRLAGALGLRALGSVLKYGLVDRTVQWNSWLLSTNLQAFDTHIDPQDATHVLLQKFPNHAVLVKNLHGFETTAELENFTRLGYQLVTSRQIYFFNGRNPTYLARSDVKRDLKSLRALKDYRQVEHHEFVADDAPRIADLYRMLYLEKHSELNPRYTTLFVQKALEQKLLEFRGLRHTSGRIDAVFACFRRGEVTSTPFIGYDTAIPNQQGFYRLLVAMLLERVAEQKLLLNYSSGAGEFKRRRGAESAIEYNAIYTRHLPLRRQLPHLLLEQAANRLGKRVLVENQI